MPDYEEQVNAWLKEHHAPITLIKGGGMAEYSSCLFETPFDETKKPGIYGIPLPLVEAKIMKDDENECGYGEIGEIFVSSPQQMHGYLNNPEETEAFFFVDKNGKKWGRTGDLGFVDKDGAFTLTSRKKHMIVRPDGHNVFPSEIENTIMATGCAKECVVVGVKDKAAIIGEYPVAFIALKPACRNDAETARKRIIQFVKDAIPVRDRPKRDEDYLILEKIPHTSEGKIDRAALIARYAENFGKCLEVKMEQNNAKRDIIMIGERLQKIWQLSAILWNIACITFAVLSFAFSIMVIILECYIQESAVIVVFFSALTAILTFMSFAINFKQQVTRYRLSFDLLNAALLDYYDKPNDANKTAVANAIKAGEKIITGTYEMIEININQ